MLDNYYRLTTFISYSYIRLTENDVNYYLRCLLLLFLLGNAKNSVILKMKQAMLVRCLALFKSICQPNENIIH